MSFIKTEKNCPKCTAETMEGYLFDHFDNAAGGQALRIEGEPEKSFWTGLDTSDRLVYAVQAFRCPRCNYLEFYTTEKVDI
jgi:predicted nucleic-acid-binding Zn-ribbon protein